LITYVDDVLRDMSREFDGLYARVGRPSIPPERLLRALLHQQPLAADRIEDLKQLSGLLERNRVGCRSLPWVMLAPPSTSVFLAPRHAINRVE
jgi:hypothetical protein